MVLRGSIIIFPGGNMIFKSGKGFGEGGFASEGPFSKGLCPLQRIKIFLESHAEWFRLAGDKYRRVTLVGNHSDKPVLGEKAFAG